MSQHHDPVVGDALRRIDVPDHGPDFWARLEGRLADGATAGPTGAPDPTEDEEQEAQIMDLDTSEAARRRRTPMLALAAAVAIVVALVVGVAVLDGGGDESQVDVADPTETSLPDTSDPDPDADPEPPGEVTDTTVAPETTSTSVVSGEELAAEAEETAAAWIDALFAGDTDTAYQLFDDPTKAQIDRARFEELSSGLFEGAAAFAAEGVERDVTVVPATDGVFHVVTFTGEVEREGMVETASYPVVVTGTGVHFTLEGPEVSLDPGYAQSSGSTLASPLELVVGEETDAWIWFDGGEPQPLAGRGAVSVDVEEAAGPGTHVVSVVATQGDDITARAYTVVVP